MTRSWAARKFLGPSGGLARMLFGCVGGGGGAAGGGSSRALCPPRKLGLCSYLYSRATFLGASCVRARSRGWRGRGAHAGVGGRWRRAAVSRHPTVPMSRPAPRLCPDTETGDRRQGDGCRGFAVQGPHPSGCCLHVSWCLRGWGSGWLVPWWCRGGAVVVAGVGMVVLMSRWCPAGGRHCAGCCAFAGFRRHGPLIRCPRGVSWAGGEAGSRRWSCPW
jgi:hypothetical protein